MTSFNFTITFLFNKLIISSKISHLNKNYRITSNLSKINHKKKLKTTPKINWFHKITIIILKKTILTLMPLKIDRKYWFKRITRNFQNQMRMIHTILIIKKHSKNSHKKKWNSSNIHLHSIYNNNIKKLINNNFLNLITIIPLKVPTLREALTQILIV